ncbi:MAG: hypothetical protein JWL84_4051 [Rhodospirillales bacterium]|jgi:hypothetical protein|nr:hypothetical protein [Rhodospirillales bacterium]
MFGKKWLALLKQHGGPRSSVEPVRKRGNDAQRILSLD